MLDFHQVRIFTMHLLAFGGTQLIVLRSNMATLSTLSPSKFCRHNKMRSTIGKLVPRKAWLERFCAWLEEL